MTIGAPGSPGYVKDCGRAIALLQLSEKVSHRTFDVGSGRRTPDRDLRSALADVVPGSGTRLADGRHPDSPAHDVYFDNTRLQQDTGYEPADDVRVAVADRRDRPRAGNPR